MRVSIYTSIGWVAIMSESKITVILKGVTMLFVVWFVWYAVIGAVIGPLDNALFPLASQYPEFMGWYPFMSSVVNYAPVIASFAIIIWMLYKGNSDTYENTVRPGGWL